MAPKVLWIGPFRDKSGWSEAAINQVLALDAAGVQVVPRCFYYNYRPPDDDFLPLRFLELEAGSDHDCDVVVQNVLPTEMEYHGGFSRNIAYFYSETSNFADTDWTRHLNLMDEVWVTCPASLHAAEKSGVKSRLSVVPVACDVSRYERSYTPHKIREELGSSFIFYTIGESTKRKNVAALIKAFHLEFAPTEPVELVIKTSVPGLSADQAKHALRAEIDKLKADLNLYVGEAHYKREHIITERLTDEGLLRLHSSCDCYVSPSHGEGWGLPAFDAMGLGKTPILSNTGAYPYFLGDESSGWLVYGTHEPVTGMQKSHGDLYTARQNWFATNIFMLRNCMRAAYADRELRGRKSLRGMERAYRFAFKEVGKLMKGLLDG